MLYDASIDASRNRPLGQPPHPSIVGHVMFPVGISNLQGDNVDLGDKPLHEMASSDFFWNGLSTKVIFADQFNHQYSIIIAEVMGSNVKLTVLQVPVSSICLSPTKCSEKLVNVYFPKPPSSTIEFEFRGVNGTPSHPTKVYLKGSKSTVAPTP